jgi:all-trans-retinol dehydrogenase (NAD+)
MSVALQRVSNLISLSVSHLALNPAVTASLLYILTKGPDGLRARLTARFAALRDPSRHATILRVLKWCLTLGLLKSLNKTLNHFALNNYRLRPASAQWHWDKEIAVVTGGCSGIGALIVKRLVNKGVTVAILDVQQLPPDLAGCTLSTWSVREGATLTFRADAHIRFYACDITDPEAVSSAAKKIREELGSPSVLVNNAGILSAHTILATTHEYLRKIFDVNVLSNWATVQAFLPDMIAQNKGHVVTVASAASYVSVAGMTDYCATKGAVLAFHEGTFPVHTFPVHTFPVHTFPVHTFPIPIPYPPKPWNNNYYYYYRARHPIPWDRHALISALTPILTRPGLTQELRLSYNAPKVLTTSIHPNWVRTPLLVPVEQELKKRGAVVMEPADVADAVAKQIFSCQGAQVFLPSSAGRSALIRALPNWMQESIRMGVARTITESVKIGGM